MYKKEDAAEIAAWLMGHLRMFSSIVQMKAAGSLRRGSEMVGDVDIVISSTEPWMTNRNIVRWLGENGATPLQCGEMKCSVRMPKAKIKGADKGIRVDFLTVKPDAFVPALMHFTGSAGHNIELARRAREDGYTLGMRGLRKTDTGEEVPFGSEYELYELLGMRYVPPERR